MTRKRIRQWINECLSNKGTWGISSSGVTIMNMDEYVKLSPKAAKILAK